MVPADCRLPKEPGKTAIQMHQEKCPIQMVDMRFGKNLAVLLIS